VLKNTSYYVCSDALNCIRFNGALGRKVKVAFFLLVMLMPSKEKIKEGKSIQSIGVWW